MAEVPFAETAQGARVDVPEPVSRVDLVDDRGGPGIVKDAIRRRRARHVHLGTHPGEIAAEVSRSPSPRPELIEVERRGRLEEHAVELGVAAVARALVREGRFLLAIAFALGLEGNVLILPGHVEYGGLRVVGGEVLSPDLDRRRSAGLDEEDGLAREAFHQPRGHDGARRSGAHDDDVVGFRRRRPRRPDGRWDDGPRRHQSGRLEKVPAPHLYLSAPRGVGARVKPGPRSPASSASGLVAISPGGGYGRGQVTDHSFIVNTKRRVAFYSPPRSSHSTLL